MARLKAILFDVDGVLVRPPHYFSAELARTGYPEAEACLNAYYHGPSQDPCLTGQADARDCILPHLRNFGWQHSPDEYFRRQFQFEHQFLDREMLAMVRQLRQRGMLCGLATDQEKHRAQYLLETMHFRDIFHPCFLSCFIGARKCHDGFWTHVLTELGQRWGIQPDQAAFFDDLPTNVAAASRFGIRACLFETVAKFRADLALLGLDLQQDQPPPDVAPPNVR